MRKHLFSSLRVDSKLSPLIGSVRFFGNSTNTNMSAELLHDLNIARMLAYKGEALEAEKKYKELIEVYPKCKQLYKELFAVWYDKGSVLGLKQWDIDWLKNRYKENFAIDNANNLPEKDIKTHSSMT